MTDRVAVVLCNLGGPDSLQAVRPFLFNLFSDPDIFKFPLGFITQKFFAGLLARRRTPEATKAYAAIGGKSPLLDNTREQAMALQLTLADDGDVQGRTSPLRGGENRTVAGAPSGEANTARGRPGATSFNVYVCMRYWHPLTHEVVAKLKTKGYDRVILLPLYPQYSLTTTGSSYNEFQRQCDNQNYHPRITLIRQWYDQPDYQQAIVETLRAELPRFPDPDPQHIELLFSAHGLPQKIVDQGDPYEAHVRATYDALRAKLGWPHTTLCYQSRVGPLKWLQPYTEKVIHEKAAAGAKQVLVYPIAFVSDHSETLYELGMLYAELAKAQGIAHYRVAPALNSHPGLIQALKSLVLEAYQQ